MLFMQWEWPKNQIFEENFRRAPAEKCSPTESVSQVTEGQVLCDQTLYWLNKMSPARLVYSSQADLLVTPVPLKGLPRAILVCPGCWWEGLSPAGPPGGTQGDRGQEDFGEQPLLGGLRCCSRREEPQHRSGILRAGLWVGFLGG